VGEIAFTPTLILPPQGGGGDEERVNTCLKGEEMKRDNSCLNVGKRKKT